MIRTFSSKDYNWTFDTVTGLFNRWGDTIKDNPQYSEFGPEILDIEVSTICHQGCKFCYKNNTSIGKNMSFKIFKTILDKVRGNLTQVAFGIGDLYANPDLLSMMWYCRNNNIIPNITINGLNINSESDKQSAIQLAQICGAVSISNYNKNTCYNTVKMLTDVGLKQVNIHQLLSVETYNSCFYLSSDAGSLKDERLKKLNAIVFLSVKQKGRGIKYTPIGQEDFNYLIYDLFAEKVKFGFDSCTAHKFLNYIKDKPEYDKLKQYVEPCESGLFSLYINVDGFAYPCSFSENNTGLDVVNCNDFIKDIWNSAALILWRNLLLACKRNCPIYNI